MENDKLISLTTVVESYKVDRHFLSSLQEFGLLNVIIVENTPCIDLESLGDVEKMIRMHYELDINLAGIDAICNLLVKIKEMQEELNRLRRL